MAKGKSGTSGIVRKLISGATGIAWVLFLIGHLAGNLLLFKQDGGVEFNKYAEFLESLGGLLYFAEFLLVVFLLMHASSGIQVWLNKKKARHGRYQMYRTAGGKSKQTLASKTMIVSGSLILIFLVMHIVTFKYNLLKPAEYTTIDGESVRNLYKYVWDSFQDPFAVGFYTLVLALLGMHMRHGIWSAFQSLGIMSRKKTDLLYRLGVIIALIIALGFISIPLYIYFY